MADDKQDETLGLSALGATFAERAGKKPPVLAKKANTTFAERAGKSVKADDGDVEDKAVKSASSKSSK